MAASVQIPTSSRTSLPGSHRLAVLAFLIVVVASPLWHLHIVDRDLIFNHSDLLPRWAGTRAALDGTDPYSRETLERLQEPYYHQSPTAKVHARPQPFLYPAPVVILLAPLAPLSWEAARLTFFLIVCPLLCLSFWLCIRSLDIPATRFDRTAVLLLALFSWPVMWGLRLQQLTLPVVAVIFVAWFLLERGHQLAPGILLALTIVKPQLVLPLLLWLLLWAVVRRQWTFIVSFAGMLALLLATTERVVPGWFLHWRDSVRHYTEITHTAPPLEFVLGHWAGFILSLLIAGAGGLMLWRLRRCSSQSREFGAAIGLAMAVAVVLVPTDPPMIYNNILLLPACLILVFRKPLDRVAGKLRILTLALLAMDLAAVPIAVAGESLLHPSSFWTVLPFLDLLLPSLATTSLILSIWHTRGLSDPAPEPA